MTNEPDAGPRLHALVALRKVRVGLVKQRPPDYEYDATVLAAASACWG